MVQTEVKSQLKTIGVASRDEVDALRKRVRELERDQGKKSDAQALPRPSGPTASGRDQARGVTSSRQRRAGLTPVAVARRRLDAELVRRGLVASRSRGARAPSATGLVLGRRPLGDKPSTLVDADAPVELVGDRRRASSSRGGEKLDAALERFGRRRRRPDASTPAPRPAGSPTACSSEAPRTWSRSTSATDSSPGRSARTTASRCSSGPTCASCDRTTLPYAPGIVVADLSFISLRIGASPALARGRRPDADLVLLVKPQFEVGRERVGRAASSATRTAWRDAIAGRRRGRVERGLLAGRA